ncbi:MAG: ATP-binding protein [Paracoccus sp. (in: a-proteobacteria)]
MADPAAPTIWKRSLPQSWRKLDLDRRLAILTGALSTWIAIMAISMLTVFSFRSISDLEHKAAAQTMNTLQSLVTEQIESLESLTLSFADVFVRRDDPSAWRSPTDFVDRISDDIRNMHFMFPGLRHARLISLSDETGTPTGGEIAFMSPEGDDVMRLPPLLLDTSYSMAFVLRAARVRQGEVTFDAPHITQDQDRGNNTTRVVLLAATVITAPSGQEPRKKLGLIMLEVDVTSLLARTARKLSEKEHFAIWPVEVHDRTVGVVAMPGLPPTATTWPELADEAGTENFEMFDHVVKLESRPDEGVLRLTYVRERVNLSPHVIALMVFGMGIIVMSAVLSTFLARAVARPITNLIAVARDVASGRKTIDELERLAQSEEENILVDAIEEMRSELDARENEIHHFAKRLQLATGTAKIGIWERTGNKDDKEFWNVSLSAALLGRDGRLVGDYWHDQRLRDYVHPDDLASFDRALTWTCGEAPEFSATLRLRMAWGDYHSYQMTGLRRYQKEETAVMSALVDIDEFKRLDQLKNELLSTVGHEMKTPLTAIISAVGLLSALLKDRIDDREKEVFAMAKKNGDSLRRIIGDILDLSCVDAGKFTLDLVKTDLGPVVRQSVRQCRDYMPEKGMTLTCEGCDQEWPVMGDEHRLAQVMRNLLSNAIKFSPAKSEVRIGIDRIGQNVRVSVRDFGPGIPEKARRSLFKRFSQIDGSDTRSHGGTGLGLAISMEITRAHDGAMGYTPADPGSIFHFSIPLA